eukprot:gnl/Trimastix_PCT/2757.p1 GENE.gnl/Trimastix_PCT/2757~~gnl/Trimastix_PCT/2757.p1  ORF type:complete len:677 (+),score=129.70 gnl/Trimastix_PCT/2757:40-2070(+)
MRMEKEKRDKLLGLPFRHPSFNTRLFILSAVRLIASLVSFIGDCDETFNYWEPTHYLMHGKGFQTWEYSPEYGLRSYFYLLLHVGLGKIAYYVPVSKMGIFFVIRGLLGVISASCEAAMLSAVDACFGTLPSILSLAFLATSAGLFQCAHTYLPSTFAMYCLTMGFATWLAGPRRCPQWLTVFFFATGPILGWPFAALCALPAALHIIATCGFWRPLKWAILTCVVLLVPSLIVDHYYYHKWICAPWNIASYNVLQAQEGIGPEIFGVEPWYFYILNLIVNFNVVAPLAFFPLLFPLMGDRVRQYLRVSPWMILLRLSPLYIWFFFMSAMPHKEERFLYVIYPLVPVAASLGSIVLVSFLMQRPSFAFKLPAWVKKWTTRNVTQRRPRPKGAPKGAPTSSPPLVSTPKRRPSKPAPPPLDIKRARRCAMLASITLVSIVALSCLLGVSRVAAVTLHYGAPLPLWAKFSTETLPAMRASLVRGPIKEDTDELRVCTGKEWYRFPSSFFLPHENDTLAFLQSGFTGLLPKPFAPLPNGSFEIPTGMNNRNMQEMDRYVDVSTCDFLVDFDFPTQLEPHYLADKATWSIVDSRPFLDAPHSARLPRAFWAPSLSARFQQQGKLQFGTYAILRNRQRIPDRLFQRAVKTYTAHRLDRVEQEKTFHRLFNAIKEWSRGAGK